LSLIPYFHLVRRVFPGDFDFFTPVVWFLLLRGEKNKNKKGGKSNDKKKGK
jgi:hypothetical protein